MTPELAKSLLGILYAAMPFGALLLVFVGISLHRHLMAWATDSEWLRT